MAPRLLWVATTPNVKTGRIPTAYVGTTRAETFASCSGCPRRDDGRCYAWTGPTGSMALTMRQRSFAERPGRHSIEFALRFRDKRARAVRVAALLLAENAVRQEGLSWLAYTHFWDEVPELAGLFMASCDSLLEADAAYPMGWIVAAVVPATVSAKQVTTPGGRKLVVCPALRDLKVTCNDCRLCDPTHAAWKHGRLAGVAFPEHGKAATNRARKQGRSLPTAGARPWRGSVKPAPIGGAR